MSRPWRRMRVVVPAVLAVVAGLTLLVLHTEWAREHVLRLALSRAAPDGSIVATGLDYNLLTLRFELEGVELRSPGDPRPYFSASRLVVDAPWSALWSPWLQEVTLVEPRLSVLVDPDGTSNFTGGGTRIEMPLPIERLDLQGLRLAWDDARYDASFSADRLDLRIAAEAAESWLRQGEPAVLRRGDASETLSVESGSIGWDGLAALLRQLALRSRPADLDIDGRIDELLADRELDLRTRAALRLDALTRLAPEAGPLEGEIALDARITGEAASPAVELSARAPALRRGRLTIDDLVAEVRWEEGLTIEQLDGGVAGGSVGMTGRLALGEGPSELRLDWSEIGLEMLIADLLDTPAVDEPATRTEGSLEVEWAEALPTAGDASGQLDARLRRTAPTGLSGSMTAGFGEGRGRLDIDLAAGSNAGNLRAEIEGALLDERPWLAGFTGQVDATVGLAGLQAYFPAAQGTTGTVRLSGGLGGDLRAPEADLDLEIVDLRYADLPAVDLTGRIRLQGDAWSVDPVVATLPGTRAEGSIGGPVDLAELRGSLRVAVADPAALLAALPASLTSNRPMPALDGGIELDVDLVARGMAWQPEALADGLEVTLTGRLDDLTVDGKGPVAGEAQARVSGSRWQLDRLDLRGPGTRIELTATGSLDLEELDGTANLVIDSLAEVVALAPASLLPAAMPGVAGRADAELSFAGGIAALRLGGSVEVDDLRVDGRGPIALRARFEPTDFGTRVSDLRISSPRSEITASGVVGPSASTLDLVARAEIGDLAGLSGLDWLDSIRRLEAEAAVGFDRDADLVTLDLWHLDVELPALTLRSERPGRLAWGPEGLSVEDLRLISGDTELTVEGSLPSSEGSGSLRTTLRGDLDDLDDLASIVWERSGFAGTAPPRATGGFDVELSLEGTLEELVPSGTARLSGAAVAVGELEPVEGIDVDLAVDRSGLRLRSLTATWRGARLLASFDIPLSHLPALGERFPDAPDRASTATLELRSASPALAAGFVPDDLLVSLGGEVDLVLELVAERPAIEALAGELRLEALRLSSGDLELQQSRPTRVAVRGSRLEVLDWDWQSPGASPWSLRVAGGADLVPAAPLESALDLRIDADLELSALSSLVPMAAMGGGLRVAAEVGGTLGDPGVEGTVSLDGVRVAIRDPRLQITGLQGTLQLQGTRISTEGITGTANSGELMLFADLDLADPMQPVGLAGITGRGVAIQVAAGVRADTDIDLTLSAQGDEGMTLLGTVTLLEGGYRSTAPLSPSSLGALTSAAPAGEPTGFLDGIRYDIRVRSADDLVVDTRFADLSLSLDLEVVGAGDRPGVIGQARLNEGGEIRLSGNTLVIDRGFIDFADASRVAPTLDIQASSRIRSHDVTVRLLGDAFSPTLEAEASGGLTEADALSLLATGRTLQEAGSSGTQILTEQAFNVVAGQVEGLARGVGVSAVRFQQAESGENWRSLAEPDLFPRTTDLSARLSITRSFGESFDLIYSQGLTRSDEQSWIGVLRLPWNLGMNAGVYDDGARAIELHHGLTFGRAANDPAVVRDVPRARIDAITFGGTPGRSEEELRRLLRLRAGDRFDYLAWRRDVERLTSSYHDGAFFEVDVQPSRRAVGEVDPETGRPSRITLHYEIEQGPRTEFVVEGFSPDAGTREQMERLWQDAVADSFLLEDLQREVTRALVGRGNAQPQVEAAFDVDTEAERRIRLGVRPGPRFGRVETRITGAEVLEQAEIDDRLDQLGLEQAAWWDPAAVAVAITALYRQRGFMEASVEIAEPVFGPDSASIEIIVREGAPRRLGALRFAGVEVVDESTLRAAIPAAPGGVLTRAWLDEAAIAIDSVYLGLAYNDAQITTSTSESNGAVDVLFEVREGPRRVLQGVEIVGRNRTRRAVVDRAIRMKPGDPLVLAEVQAIRRRLLATDAIQSASLQIRDAGPVVDGVRPGRLVVTIVELPMFDIRYGVQLLSDTLEEERRTRPGVSASVAHQNFLGSGARVSLLGRYRQNEPFGRFAVSFPRLLGLPIRTTLLAQRSREQTGGEGAFTVRRDETRLLGEQRLQLGRLRIGYSYSWEENLNQILDLPPDSPFQLPAIHVARLIPTLIWDSRDDGFAPTRGLFHSSTYEIADESLGSELEFTRYYGQQFVFLPVGPVVLATAVRFGSGVSHDPNSEILPRGELFLAGGGTTVRGYPDDSLGRTEFFGSFFAGGNAVLILNQEARFPIWRWLEGVAFMDGGSAFQSMSEIDLSSLAWSAGAGLRLVTPYVTLRLDYGLRLTDVEYLESATGRLHFGIGHIF